MKNFTVIPAIDLKDGRCVRLRQGLAAEQTVYSMDPVKMALRWQEEGAELLHVVDLDGAFQGKPVHTDLIAKIARAISIPLQVGGGLRTEEHIRKLVDFGVARVILGTSAYRAAEETARLAGVFKEKLAIGIDARAGDVQVNGWTQGASINFLTMAERVAMMNVKTIIYTNTSMDGMLQGPDVEGVQAICGAVQCDVIASGGVSTVENVAALKSLLAPNLVGAIVGKALYEETVTLEELKRAAARNPKM